MIIKTKYNLGDKVWLKHKSKGVQGEVNEIEILVSDSYIDIRYSVNLPEWGCIWLDENEIASTKEELLESL